MEDELRQASRTASTSWRPRRARTTARACSSTARPSRSSTARRRAAGGAGRAGALSRRHALSVAPRAAHRRAAPAAAELDGQGGQRPARGRSDQPRPGGARRRPGATARSSCICFAPSSCGGASATSGCGCRNFGLEPTSDRSVSCQFDADFADIFEVRGSQARAPRPACCRPARGRYGGAGLSRARRGGAAVAADVRARRRRSRRLARARSSSRCRRARRSTLLLTIGCEVGDRGAALPRAGGADATFGELQAELHKAQTRRCLIRSPNDPAQRLDEPVARGPADDDHRDRRRGPIRTPACPGSARRSAATGSSRRSRSCGWSRSWRAACSATWRADAGDRPPIPAQTRSPARSCTRRAAARWQPWARCPSSATTAASTRRRCS